MLNAAAHYKAVESSQIQYSWSAQNTSHSLQEHGAFIVVYVTVYKGISGALGGQNVCYLMAANHPDKWLTMEKLSNLKKDLNALFDTDGIVIVANLAI